MTSSIPSSSPGHAAPRRALVVILEPPEHRHRPLPSCYLAADDWNPSSRWATLQIYFHLLDLDLAIHNSSLTRTGIARSEPSRSHKIQRSRMLIRPKRYQPMTSRHVASPWLVWISN
jgi:hypothetical protein